MTAAEVLLVFADGISGRGIVDMTGCRQDVGKVASRVKLGLELKRRHALCLRAIVEEWPPERIVREIY